MVHCTHRSKGMYKGCRGHTFCTFPIELLYKVIQEELLPLMELISEDILSKKCHLNLGPILNIYRDTFVIGIFLNFNYKIT
jgi:hypothetical protein